MNNYVETDQDDINVINNALAEQAGWIDSTALLALHVPKLLPLNEKTSSVTSLVAGRDENQDYGIAFQVAHHMANPIIMVVADGLGGYPGGRAASFLACKGVVEAAVASVDQNMDSLLASLRRSAASAVTTFAAHTPPDTCLTTVIIAIVTQDSYFLTWLGDGGAFIRRKNRKWEPMMNPHRGPSGYLHEVGGAVGITQKGFWSVAESARKGGDLFMLGSDGVTERIGVKETFFQRPLNHVAEGATLQLAMTEWLTGCSTEQPDVFDDNMTLVTFMTPTELSHSDAQKIKSSV